MYVPTKSTFGNRVPEIKRGGAGVTQIGARKWQGRKPCNFTPKTHPKNRVTENRENCGVCPGTESVTASASRMGRSADNVFGPRLQRTKLKPGCVVPANALGAPCGLHQAAIVGPTFGNSRRISIPLSNAGWSFASPVKKSSHGRSSLYISR